MGKRAWGLVGIGSGVFVLGLVVLWLVFEVVANRKGQQCQVPVVVNVYGCCGGQGVVATPKAKIGPARKANAAPVVKQPEPPCPLPGAPVPPAVLVPEVPRSGSDNRGQYGLWGPGGGNGGGGSNPPIRQVPELSSLEATGLGLGLVIAAMWRD